MKVLLAGLGSIGKRHLNNLQLISEQLGLHLQVILCRSSGKHDELTNKFPTLYDYNEGLAYKPDVVIIAVPTYLHMEYSLKAAQSGAHIFVEKPLSHNLNQIHELMETLHPGQYLMIGCNMRFHPGLKCVKQLIDEQTAGRVLAASAHAGQYLPDWRPGLDYKQTYSAKQAYGGGVILDLIHEIDYLYWLFGDFTDVFACTAKLSQLEIDTEDIAEIILTSKSGILAHVHLDYLQRNYSRYCRIICEKGTILWDDHKEHICLFMNGKMKHIPIPDHDDRNKMYLDELEHFFSCIINDRPPLIDVWQGKRVLEIALAAKASAAQKKIIKLKSGE